RNLMEEIACQTETGILSETSCQTEPQSTPSLSEAACQTDAQLGNQTSGQPKHQLFILLNSTIYPLPQTVNNANQNTAQAAAPPPVQLVNQPAIQTQLQSISFLNATTATQQNSNVDLPGPSTRPEPQPVPPMSELDQPETSNSSQNGPKSAVVQSE